MFYLSAHLISYVKAQGPSVIADHIKVDEELVNTFSQNVLLTQRFL